MKKAIFATLLAMVMLNAGEIKIEGEYKEDFVNPFKSVIADSEKKKISIKVNNKDININVSSNATDNVFTANRDNKYTFNNQILVPVLNGALSEEYNISSNGNSNVIEVNIDNVSVYIDYWNHDNSNDISAATASISGLEVKMKLTININGKVLLSKNIEGKGNLRDAKDKFIGIFSTDDFDGKSISVENNVGGFIEKSVYSNMYSIKDLIQNELRK